MTQYQPHTPPKLHNHGFTLVELMVTIAVMGIIAAMAAPSFSQALANKRIESASKIIPDAVQFAKSQALINRQSLNITIGTEKVEVTRSGGGDPLEIYNINNSLKITAKNSAPMTLSVSPKGTVSQTDGSAIPDNAYFEICDKGVSGASGRKVVVSAVGQVQVTTSGVVCS